MNNLSGIWEGEFSFNHGSEEEPDVEYTPFRMVLQDNNGKITGSCEDLDIDFEASAITGFLEAGMLSLIKKYKHLLYEDEQGDLYADDTQPHPDIHYTATFNHEEQVFMGTWEMVEEQERLGYTDQYLEKYLTGDWYMKMV